MRRLSGSTTGSSALATPCSSPAVRCRRREYIPFDTHKKSPFDCWVYVRQYCAKIDEAARNRMELIVPELAKRNGVTEKLKADTKWNGYGR